MAHEQRIDELAAEIADLRLRLVEEENEILSLQADVRNLQAEIEEIRSRGRDEELACP